MSDSKRSRKRTKNDEDEEQLGKRRRTAGKEEAVKRWTTLLELPLSNFQLGLLPETSKEESVLTETVYWVRWLPQFEVVSSAGDFSFAVFPHYLPSDEGLLRLEGKGWSDGLFDTISNYADIDPDDFPEDFYAGSLDQDRYRELLPSIARELAKQLLPIPSEVAVLGVIFSRLTTKLQHLPLPLWLTTRPLQVVEVKAPGSSAPDALQNHIVEDLLRRTWTLDDRDTVRRGYNSIDLRAPDGYFWERASEETDPEAFANPAFPWVLERFSRQKGIFL